jgi:hypothetical protein
MSELRERFIEEMKLKGLAEGTRKVYVQVIKRSEEINSLDRTYQN